ncbi:pentatricopeptide repeat-containing protein At5g59600 [Asparagus officinalis]|uniref:pentatricopeptide repeat-containing protein At5g59600 n=1 Tax=Asparagus officinalis TaxID=4686 RepID=UPI00098E55BF|nr:pentatricopeptide repeat-containing protein At5g59600 [Asparagus officinalis]
MVSGYTHLGFAEKALVLVVKMQFRGMKPDSFTWNTLISGFSQLGKDELALDLFRLMKIDGIEPDVFSWTSIISGFVQNFKYDKAFEVLRQMVVLDGIKPSSVTVCSLLPACANVMNLRRGKEIHGYALIIGIGEDLFVNSSLIDMYAKCGHIFEAEKIFNRMRKRSIISWNSMIFGYSNHGHFEKAIKLFYQIENDGLSPDHLTFTAVFTACSHAGMIELGENLFRLMKDEYRIEPRLEHYACIVDLLARAGRLDKAYEFIRVMPVKPDSFVWGALLGACRKHGNVHLAEIAASNLADLEPESSGSCVMMSNMFMDAGRWNDALKMEKGMRKKMVERYLGCSWLQNDQ